MIKTQEIFKIKINSTSRTEEEIKSKSRIKNIVFARMAFIYIAREHGYSFQALGCILNRDHTSIMHLYKKSKNIEFIKNLLIGNINGDIKSLSEKVGQKNKSRYKNIYDLYGGKCVVCGFDEIVEVHHIIPRYLGGGDQLSNIVILCPNHHSLADRGMIKIKDIHIKNNFSTSPTTTINI